MSGAEVCGINEAGNHVSCCLPPKLVQYKKGIELAACLRLSRHACHRDGCVLLGKVEIFLEV